MLRLSWQIFTDLILSTNLICFRLTISSSSSIYRYIVVDISGHRQIAHLSEIVVYRCELCLCLLGCLQNALFRRNFVAY